MEPEESEEPGAHVLSGPLKIIIGLFLLIILIMWAVPHYYIKDDPWPQYNPAISEVVRGEYTISKLPAIDSPDKYRLYVNTRDPQLKAVADKISSLACGYSENYIICQSKALYFFVRDRFDYVKDPSSFEYVKQPLESLNNLGGDCDDASVLLASLLGSIGVRTRLVFVPSHVYVQAYLPEAKWRYKGNDDWVDLDATCKNCEFGKLAKKYDMVEYLDVT